MSMMIMATFDPGRIRGVLPVVVWLGSVEDGEGGAVTPSSPAVGRCVPVGGAGFGTLDVGASAWKVRLDGCFFGPFGHVDGEGRGGW